MKKFLLVAIVVLTHVPIHGIIVLQRDLSNLKMQLTNLQTLLIGIKPSLDADLRYQQLLVVAQKPANSFSNQQEFSTERLNELYDTIEALNKEIAAGRFIENYLPQTIQDLKNYIMFEIARRNPPPPISTPTPGQSRPMVLDRAPGFLSFSKFQAGLESYPDLANQERWSTGVLQNELKNIQALETRLAAKQLIGTTRQVVLLSQIAQRIQQELDRRTGRLPGKYRLTDDTRYQWLDTLKGWITDDPNYLNKLPIDSYSSNGQEYPGLNQYLEYFTGIRSDVSRGIYVEKHISDDFIALGKQIQDEFARRKVPTTAEPTAISQMTPQEIAYKRDEYKDEIKEQMKEYKANPTKFTQKDLSNLFNKIIYYSKLVDALINNEDLYEEADIGIMRFGNLELKSLVEQR
jgi:hypothetical protein